MHGEKSINESGIARDGWPTRKSKMIGIQRLLRKWRNEGSGNDGFTLVELSIVMVISLVILAGVVVLLSGTFDILKSSRSLLAITDSSRRALSTMSRQLRGALHFVNGPGRSDADALTFYADITGETKYYSADVITSPNWENGPLVKWWRDPSTNVIRQATTEPGQGGTTTTADLASNVKELKFEYYTSGSDTVPIGSPGGYDINKNATRIRIKVTVQKDSISRTLSQDVFLRVPQRVPEQEAILISSVSPSRELGPWSGTVTIVGTNTHFVQGTSQVNFEGSSGITLSNTTVISPTELTVTVTVDDNVSGTPKYYRVNVVTGAEIPFPKSNGFEVD